MTTTWTDPNAMRIDLSSTAYRKMMAAVASTQLEVSGYGRVAVYHEERDLREPLTMRRLKAMPKEGPYGFVFRIEDVWLLDIGSGAETTIQPPVAARWLAERVAAGDNPEQLKLWWHRHPLTGGWSGTDERAIRKTPMGNTGDPEGIGWMVSIVWCTATSWNGRFDQLAKPGLTIHCPVTIESQPQFEPTIQAELSTLYAQHKPRHIITAVKPLFDVQQAAEDAAMMREVAEEMALLDHTLDRALMAHDYDLAAQMMTEQFWEALADMDWGDIDAYQLCQELTSDLGVIVSGYGFDAERIRRLFERTSSRYDIDVDVFFDIAYVLWGRFEPANQLPLFRGS
ncbi:hypothetical protein [Aggregatilinea lenta]|uniref:hypothetical protein n=1 Tax=Aggregatilinea lenta TaxID=913108 RepID=UPI000E5BFBEC|nr:hypothetical protein [Aggregatilinea lenta]